MPAHCIRGSVSATLRGAHSCISTPCVCVADFFTATFWQSWATPLWALRKAERVVGSLDVQWWLWPTDPVIHKHQLHSVSVGLSVITLLNSVQSHQITARAGDEGQTSFEKLTLFTRTGKGVPTTNQHRLASFVELPQYSNLHISLVSLYHQSVIVNIFWGVTSRSVFVSRLFDPVSINPLCVFLLWLVFP